MATSQARFKWTDDKLTNLIKCLQEKVYPMKTSIKMYQYQYRKAHQLITKKKKVKNNTSINSPAPKLIDNVGTVPGLTRDFLR